MFIDTHCHLTYDLKTDTDVVINNAYNNNVKVLICATADPKDIEPSIKIAEKYDNVFLTTGIHPDYIDTDPSSFLTETVLSHPKVIGVGEIGLDYHYTPETRQKQLILFEKQLQIALDHDLPIAIHTRDAEEDTMAF